MPVIINNKTITSQIFNTTSDTRSTPVVSTQGLVYWLDFGNLSSYHPGTTYYDCGYGCQFYSSNPGCVNCNTQVKDLSGWASDGTLVNTPVLYHNGGVTGHGGYASFNGTTSSVTTPNSFDLNMVSSLTVSIWFSLEQHDLASRQVLISKHFTGYEVTIEPNGVVHTYTGNGNGSSYDEGLFGTNRDGKWLTHRVYHILWSLSGRTEKLYINGELRTTFTKATTNTRATTFPLVLGMRADASLRFKGRIYMAQVYNIALDHTNSLQLFHKQKLRFGDALSTVVTLPPPQTGNTYRYTFIVGPSDTSLSNFSLKVVDSNGTTNNIAQPELWLFATNTQEGMRYEFCSQNTYSWWTRNFINQITDPYWMTQNEICIE
jgi:hypothetical protein